MVAAKIKPVKYRNTANIYPMDGGMVMTFLDDSTLLFGDSVAIRIALDVRDGQVMSLDTNQTMADMNVERGFGAGLEHSGSTGNAERDASAVGRCLPKVRL